MGLLSIERQSVPLWQMSLPSHPLVLCLLSLSLISCSLSLWVKSISFVLRTWLWAVSCPLQCSFKQPICILFHRWPPLISLWSAIFSKDVSPPSFSICEMSLIVSYTMEWGRKRCPVHGKEPFVLVQVVNALDSPLGWIWLSWARCIHSIIVGSSSAVEHCWFLMRSENVQPTGYLLVHSENKEK